MKVLNVLALLMILILTSCSKDESGLDQFIGKWEMNRMSTVNCDDFSFDLLATEGGCINFDGSVCMTAEVFENGTASLTQKYNDDFVSDDTYSLTYTYTESTNSILLCGDGECLDGIIEDGNLVLNLIEDTCDIRHEMRKI